MQHSFGGAQYSACAGVCAARSTASIRVHVRCSFALILTITILLSLHVAGGKLFGMWYCLAVHLHWELQGVLIGDQRLLSHRARVLPYAWVLL